MIDWESILPNEYKASKFCDQEEKTESIWFNEGRRQCLIALKQAEQRGEICKPLGVNEMYRLIDTVAAERTKERNERITGGAI